MTESERSEPTPADVWRREYVPAGHGLSRRGWTVLLSMVVVVVFGLLAGFVKIPYVALGPGPTCDTLGTTDCDGEETPEARPVVQIVGDVDVDPDSEGELRLTTVSVADDITLFGGIALWISGGRALAPRDDYFPPGEDEEEVRERNVKMFEDSQSAAELAALRHLDPGVDIVVVVREIEPGFPAEEVLDVGDQLIEVNGAKVSEPMDVRNALDGTVPGDEISVTFTRDGGEEQTATMTLAEAEDGREQGFMGLVPGEHAEVDFTIDIELADVGGPSAGLMFALAIVDRLTPGDDLTGGERIAGSGEISPDGVVGAIGGISFKVAAADRSDVTVFLVPEQNCAEAVRAAPDDMQLVKVGTLDDAVEALDAIEVGDRPTSC